MTTKKDKVTSPLSVGTMARPAEDLVTRTHDRFLDADREQRQKLQPLDGYQHVPKVSLEQAVQPILGLCPDIIRRVHLALQNYRSSSPNLLSQDEAASIFLYTMESTPKSQCLYYVLNKSLRSANRNEVTPWFSYLRLIIDALSRLPSNRLVVWRGVKGDLSAQYEMGQDYVWWSLSSCTESLPVLESEEFLGTSKARTLFNIQCESGKRICQYSHFASEDEVLLPPATRFFVKGKLQPSPDLHIIQLQEVNAQFAPVAPPLPTKAPVKPYSNAKLERRLARCLPDCLYVGEMDLTDVDVPFLVRGAIDGKNTSYLDCNHNSITGDGARLIADVLPRNTSLKVLRLWSNQLWDVGAGHIARALCANRTLSMLCLATNGLTDVAARDLGEMLQVNTNLSVLYLDNNIIGNAGMRSLMEAMCSNRSLRKLYLDCNMISDECNDSIKRMMNENGTLKLLTLAGNRFTELGQVQLQMTARGKTGFKLSI